MNNFSKKKLKKIILLTIVLLNAWIFYTLKMSMAEIKHYIGLMLGSIGEPRGHCALWIRHVSNDNSFLLLCGIEGRKSTETEYRIVVARDKIEGTQKGMTFLIRKFESFLMRWVCLGDLTIAW